MTRTDAQRPRGLRILHVHPEVSMHRFILSVLLAACAAPPAEGPSAFEMPPPPPGSGSMTLAGPAEVVSGETVSFEVTAPGLQPGDVVELGAGTAEGPGMCPHRPQTGGSPCLDVTGRMSKLGMEAAFNDGGTVKAVFTLDLTKLDPVLYTQAFFLNGGSSATSNVWPVVIRQPWPQLDPRVEDLEAIVSGLEDLVEEQGATIVMLQSALEAAQMEVASLQVDMGDLEGTTSSLQSDLIMAQGDIDMLETGLGSLSTLPGDLSALSGMVSGIDMRLGTAEAGLGMAQSDLSLLASDLSALQLAFSGLSTVPGDLATAMADIITLRSDLTMAQSELTMLDSDLTTAQSDITTLESNLTQTDADLGVVESDLADLQGDVSAMGTSLTVTGPVRIGSSIYNAWSGLIPVGGGGYSSDPVHFKTNWSCVGGTMWNVQFEGYNFLAERPIRTASVGYAYSAAGGIVYKSDKDLVDGTTVPTTYCSSDNKVSFKLTSNAVGANKWHASNVVLNLIGGPSSYAAAAANSFQILTVENRASNF